MTHIGMFRRQLARSFGHLRRSSVGPTDPSAAGDRSQHDPSSHSGSAGIYREGSAAKLADGPVTDGNLATGPNPSATAAKVKVTYANMLHRRHRSLCTVYLYQCFPLYSQVCV